MTRPCARPVVRVDLCDELAVLDMLRHPRSAAAVYLLSRHGTDYPVNVLHRLYNDEQRADFDRMRWDEAHAAMVSAVAATQLLLPEELDALRLALRQVFANFTTNFGAST